MVTRQAEHARRMREAGFSARVVWLDEETLAQIKAMLGRYGKNQSEVMAKAVQHLHKEAKRRGVI